MVRGVELRDDMRLRKAGGKIKDEANTGTSQEARVPFAAELLRERGCDLRCDSRSSDDSSEHAGKGCL